MTPYENMTLPFNSDDESFNNSAKNDWRCSNVEHFV